MRAIVAAAATAAIISAVAFAGTIPNAKTGGGGGGMASTDIDTSSELKTILTDETGSGAACFATSPTFTTSVILGAAGVSITDDADGAITLKGLGDGTDEDLTLNLDDTTNVATWSSSTGVATWSVPFSIDFPGAFRLYDSTEELNIGNSGVSGFATAAGSVYFGSGNVEIDGETRFDGGAYFAGTVSGLGTGSFSAFKAGRYASASGFTLSATTDSYLWVDNTGASSRANFVLPGAVGGLVYGFIVADADGIKVTAAAGDTIRIGTSASAGAGYICSTTIGSVINILAINATEWIAIDEVGTAFTVDSGC